MLETFVEAQKRAGRLTELSEGGGCACKYPQAALSSVLSSLSEGYAYAGHGALGLRDGEDAAIYPLDEKSSLVVTCDFQTPVLDDCYTWGMVAAENALSDVYAMGGRPLMALNLTAWPLDRDPDQLAEVLRGGGATAARAGIAIMGGHTIYDSVPKYGLAVVGTVASDRLLLKSAGRPGDILVLTKPLGTGMIVTALKKGTLVGTEADEAVGVMLRSNRLSSEVALEFGIECATDVTGFGLMGHLHEIAERSICGAAIDVRAVPFLQQAMALARDGRVTSGGRRNRDFAGAWADWGATPAWLMDLLTDPQTSGGMLFACGAEKANALIDRLRERGEDGWIIGELTADYGGAVTLRGSGE